MASATRGAVGTASPPAAPERVRSPRLAADPAPELRPLLTRGYAGFTEATSPRHLVLPATTAVPLAEQLRDTPSWRQRFALLDEFLLRRLDDGPRPAPEVARAWQRLVATGGRVPIGRLASEVGWRHEHLIARFRQQVGVGPKTAARLVRFNSVWRRLDQRRPLDWGLVAAESGYADQAHLIRDFRQFTGWTPTQFPADGEQEVKFVQDAVAMSS